MQFLSGIVQAIFSRWFIIYLFTIATLFSSVQTMIHRSFAVGIGALAATYLTFFLHARLSDVFLRERKESLASSILLGLAQLR